MVYSKDELNTLINKYLEEITNLGVKVEEAYLYGSYAKGLAHEFSDIDIAIVSKDFQGDWFDDLSKIRDAKYKTTYSFSPRTYKKDDFTDDDLFVREIKETGIRLV